MTAQSPAPFRITPWVRRLLLANLAVYVLSVTIFVGPWFETTFAFSPLDAANRPWTFLTYGFVHGGLLHLAFNMLMLLFFGPGVERRMGGGAFTRYYLLCGLGGPVLAFGLSLIMPVAPFIGASAAVFGVALAFALAWPHARIFVFPVPFPIPVKYLVAFLVSMTLVPALFGIQDGFASLAHLGGFVFGLLYLKSEDYAQRRGQTGADAEAETPVLVHHQQQTEEAEEEESSPPAAAPTPRGPTREEISREMDRVLDKISQRGIESLTSTERAFLDTMSKLMRDD